MGGAAKAYTKFLHARFGDGSGGTLGYQALNAAQKKVMRFFRSKQASSVSVWDTPVHRPVLRELLEGVYTGDFLGPRLSIRATLT